MRLFTLLAFSALVAACASDPPKPFMPAHEAPTPHGCLEQRARAAELGEKPGC